MYFLRRIVLSIAIILSIIGCQDSGQKPRLIDQENSKKSYAQTILGSSSKPKISDEKRLELESKKEIAKIEMQKAIEIEKIKAEVEKAKILNSKDKFLKEIEVQIDELKASKNFKFWIIFTTLVIFGVIVWLIYKLFKHHQATKLKIHREKIEAEKELKEKELQVRVVEKMIDAMGEGKLSEEQQKLLLESINKSSKILPHK
ncbi:hypothetical protein RZR97_00025 [Hydrogenimonas thermophila]|uniref:hypothetical protein n=1 Tax=Hydrogenimonas thermophila TaxID=223786 RepID=UPI0029370D81|nr:hypothetical protein [Hydrogenimonas thermophila]WOE69993.1 hypothetical protein RZR91_00025 [Hydrogenimonas thermophila]WOE72510.1 hypothetical protein RZR97_00025 [Hydrogenimonas thermophila]